MSVTPATNATGWNELINAAPIDAVYTMYDTAFGSMGWPVTILFFVFQGMLLFKTGGNLRISFITSVFFLSLFSAYLATAVIEIVFLLLALEMAGILYLWLWK